MNTELRFTAEVLLKTFDDAVEALRELRDIADGCTPCAEQSRSRDALEALGQDRDN